MTKRKIKTITAHLGDGTEVSLRPIRPDDKPLLTEAMTRLSPRSRHLRFMAPIETLSRSQLAYLTEIDHRRHLAWGVLIGDEPAAVGRVVRLGDDPASAELAITVVDQYQGRGIGRLLVELLAEISRNQGIERYVFEALPENNAIISLLRSYGAEYVQDGGVVTGSLRLGSIPPPPVRLAAAWELAMAAQTPAD